MNVGAAVHYVQINTLQHAATHCNALNTLQHTGRKERNETKEKRVG